MLMPSIFGETLLDDFWGFPMRDNYMRTANTNGLMQTDVEEHDNAYEITMNLPGFKKEDVKGEIKDGYLTITASTNTNNDEKDKEGKFIRRERYSGTCSRSFYVGEDVTQDEIKAKFVDGVLKVAIPKKESKPQVEKSQFISIEG
jgi:HSP20 family molecular chaperone IbpA